MKKVFVFSLLTTYLLAGEAIVFEDTPVLDGKHSTKTVKAKVYSSDKQDAFSRKLYKRYKRYFSKKHSQKSYQEPTEVKTTYRTSSHDDAIIAHDELILPEE